MKVKILNTKILSVSKEELLESNLSGIVVTPNIDHLMKLQNDSLFYDIYTEADYILCDSKIIQLLSILLGTPIKEQITGSDFFPAFCEYHGNINSGKKVFLLGGTTNKIVKQSAKNINACSKGIIIGYYSPPFGFETDEVECENIIKKIEESGANVLAVGVGAPKQEKFIYKYKNRLTNIDLFFAIGATIDFESGVLPRAPKWMTKIGLEWFFRMIKDPKRLVKRYLIDDIPFFFLIFKQMIGLYKNPFVGKPKK